MNSIEKEKEIIFITQNFRITKSMKRKIAEYSKKMGEGNKSEFLRTAVNFLISYFEDKDFFEILEKKVFDSLFKYETKKIMDIKMGEHSIDLIKVNLERSKDIPGAENKFNELIEKIREEGKKEIKDKFDDFIKE